MYEVPGIFSLMDPMPGAIDDHESDAEFDAAFESRRAWRFGRGN
jgi:hypothetical protein